MVGRALVALLKRQTNEEQNSNDTREENGIGFSGADARSGSLTAKSFIKYKGRLLDWQLDKWTKATRNGYPRISKYHRQLNEIALEKKPAQGRVESKGCSRAQYVAAKQGMLV